MDLKLEDANEFLDDEGNWICTMCGACCLMGPLMFPEHEISDWDRGDGGCKNLNSRMRCRIYEDRPSICKTRVNSPNATELERAFACAGLKKIMDREIELKKRSPIGKKWRY